MKIKEQLQNLLKNKIDYSLLNNLPSGYSRTGDIAIFHHIDKEIQNYRRIIGEAIIQLDPQVNVVVEQRTTHTIHRKPQIIHLAGEKRYNTEHKEFDTIFHLDVSEITFSPGNKGERNYLIKTVRNNEIICDMFACIGNLSLPIIVNNSTVKAHGIEINETAFKFLKKNIKVNKLEERYFPILGDNREKTPRNIGNRILMGYFETDEKQLECAIQAINQEGWIHYHNIAPRDDLTQSEKFVEKMSKKGYFVIKELKSRKIKKYSPRQYHICTDIFIQKNEGKNL